ncbi:MAG: hypothetical protein GEU94_05610 [Micromonosporaceae bacterium]|nr:hypothetical protein [Micromonosporaceae bacterium]
MSDRVFKEVDIESVHRRLVRLEHEIDVQRRMLAPVCMVTGGLVLAFASFGLISRGEYDGTLLEGWTALFFVYVLVMLPLTALAVGTRTIGLKGVAAAAWGVIAVVALCIGAGPRPNLAEVLGPAPWCLFVASLINLVGLIRLPSKS